MMGNPCFLSPSSSLTREFQQKCPRQQQRKTKNQLSQCNCSVLQCRSHGNFLTEASPLQRQPIAAGNQHAGYRFHMSIRNFEERPFFDLRKTAFKCIYKSEASNVNIFGKTDNIRQDLVMYTFFPGFSVFLFSIIGLGRNETIGEEQEKRWGMKRMKKGEQGN